MFWAGFEPAILQFLDRRPRPLIHRSLLEIGIILQFLFTIFHNFLRAQFNLWAQCGNGMHIRMVRYPVQITAFTFLSYPISVELPIQPKIQILIAGKLITWNHSYTNIG